MATERMGSVWVPAPWSQLVSDLSDVEPRLNKVSVRPRGNGLPLALSVAADQNRLSVSPSLSADRCVSKGLKEDSSLHRVCYHHRFWTPRKVGGGKEWSTNTLLLN
ncbi:hypothetical protein CesoFtcFv8_004380 [Champsocephalus esox]|uniref:Uncharacterized protein n=1 Tax=Champsocephalus esox TaxID=159716 RepID=A0AAN8CUB3_9TELE|nr:hypothetical protein CesoFtcFv8_004380 [Champsocephalus esox]